jgi:hypothetical protein
VIEFVIASSSLTGDLCASLVSRGNDIKLRRKRIEAGHQLPKLLAIALQLDQAFLDRRGDVQLLEADLVSGWRPLAFRHPGSIENLATPNSGAWLIIHRDIPDSITRSRCVDRALDLWPIALRSRQKSAITGKSTR